jgi:DNA mismatch repair ATPase MutS
MKEKDLIELQEKADNQKLYLVKVGMFYHAYNAGAYAIARLMHYKIKRKHRKGGDILVAGFPVRNLPDVTRCIESKGGTICSSTENSVVFSGVDVLPDETLIEADAPSSSNNVRDAALKDAIRNFDLMNSSPMNAMNL